MPSSGSYDLYRAAEEQESLVWANILPMFGLNGSIGLLVKILTSVQCFGIVFNLLDGGFWENGYAQWLMNLCGTGSPSKL